ncbi:hypothetical protein [Yoonia sp.]|uniref:hypothetical protein n=1 Tax=Yoonia sp. TaxID=2212373 RepID=UPI003919F449
MFDCLWLSDAQARRGWMNSSGHRAKILRHGVAAYGIGKRGDYWVMVRGQSC